jgi:hypothetical protein
MRTVLLIWMCACTLSCNKIVEDVKRNAILDIMTNGQWYVEYYFENSNDRSAQFDGYFFQFNDDGTVTGQKASFTEQGTWKENITDYSITADFPSAGEPVSNLNGKWIWKDSGNDFVITEKTADSATYKLKLRKKP